MTLKEAGQKAVEAALRYWALRIHDHPKSENSECAARCNTLIDDFIRSPVGLGWEWRQAYRGDGDFKWCGAFVAASWSHGGLVMRVREHNVASTARLKAWGRGARHVRPENIRAGDIVVVGKKNPDGDHILIAVDPPENGHLSTVEGNGHGNGPDGTWYEGVIRRHRPVASIFAAYRPLPEDLGVLASA